MCVSLSLNTFLNFSMNNSIGRIALFIFAILEFSYSFCDLLDDFQLENSMHFLGRACTLKQGSEMQLLLDIL